MMNEDALSVLIDIRNWTRAASWASVKKQLEIALPSEKARVAYQATDGEASIAIIREKCKMSPNDVVALHALCISMGLMQVAHDNRRKRIFDLEQFGLIDPVKNGRKKSP